MKYYSIAIDGTAGSGKGTVGKLLSNKLGINYVSTGAVFRAIGLYCLNNEIDPTNKYLVENVCQKSNISIKFINGEQYTFLNEDDVTQELNSSIAGVYAAKVGVHAISHIKAAQIIRALAKDCSIVVDGREIGYFMLPNATVKFYLDAKPEERAKRRFLQLKDGENITYEQILEQIIERDRLDITRENFPLKRCEDAVYIDSTNMSINEVVQCMYNKVMEKINS